MIRKLHEVQQQKGASKFTGVINPNLDTAKLKSKNVEEKEKSRSAPRRREERPDEDLLKKSQKILQAKSQFYDKMMTSGGSLNSDETCLVMFSEKRAQREERKIDTSDDDGPKRRYSNSSSDSSPPISDDDDNLPEDEQWVEYTDCLGRTRKCLKKDLEFFKKKDHDLKRTEVIEEGERTSPSPDRERKVPGLSTSMSTLPSIDDGSNLEEMRKNWETKAAENAERDEIHYQDVLFDEARSHGVGYYQFSQDEKQRAMQQEQLATERESTVQAQKQREHQIKNREKIIAERVRAAKNRQRERLGLPRLEDDRKHEMTEEKKERRAEEKRKRKEREKEDQLEAEIRKNAKKRKQHLRPWDKDKEDSKCHSSDDDSEEGTADEWKYKPEREPMSQEQWNAMQRDVRNQEFAPVSNVSARFDGSSNTSSTSNISFAGVRAPRIRRNLDSSNSPSETMIPEANATSSTYDYYNNFKVPANPPGKGDLQQSIAAGLRFLRDQSDKGTTSNKHTWTQKADY